MTRDEAIQKVKEGSLVQIEPGQHAYEALIEWERRATEAVDIAVALGLKLDEPKTVEQQIDSMLVCAIGYQNAEFILNRLKVGGLKIVRSEPNEETLKQMHKTWFHGTDENWMGQHTSPESVKSSFVRLYRAMIESD